MQKILLTVLVLGTLIFAADYGLSRRERFECEQWQKGGWIVSNWQAEQCNRYGIKVIHVY